MKKTKKPIKEDKRKSKFFRQQVTEGMRKYWANKKGHEYCPRCERMVNPNQHKCFLTESEELITKKDNNIKAIK